MGMSSQDGDSVEKARAAATPGNDSQLGTPKETDELRISPDKELAIAELSAAHAA